MMRYERVESWCRIFRFAPTSVRLIPNGGLSPGGSVVLICAAEVKVHARYGSSPDLPVTVSRGKAAWLSVSVWFGSVTGKMAKYPSLCLGKIVLDFLFVRLKGRAIANFLIGLSGSCFRRRKIWVFGVGLALPGSWLKVFY